ncbi:MAG: hypothetical protein Q8K79_13150 [Solirubrobacteraceae bacterium]|nr:hypothetical protein [Solirubrobacteraceae bacterium]
MTARRLLALLVALLLVGAPAGCGGDEEGGRDSTDETADSGGEERPNGGGEGEDPARDGDDTTGDVEDEEPTANNQVLLGAQFFGEQPARFGVVAIGDSKTVGFDVKAFGDTRRIVGVSVTGDAAGDFRPDPGTCAPGTEIVRGTTCTLRVTFTPTVEGVREAALRIDVEPGVSGGRSLEGGAPPPQTTTTATQTQTAPAGAEVTPTTPGSGAAAPPEGTPDGQSP